MSAILSHPFRLAPSGSVATVEQDTAAADAEQIAVLILTRTGERPLVPAFGISDPVFAELNPAEVLAGIATYGPPVDIESFNARPAGPAGTELVVELEFD